MTKCDCDKCNTEDKSSSIMDTISIGFMVFAVIVMGLAMLVVAEGFDDAVTYNYPETKTITIADHFTGYDEYGNYKDYYIGTDGKKYVSYEIWSTAFVPVPQQEPQNIDVGKTYVVMVFNYKHQGIPFLTDHIYGIKHIVRDV